VKSTLMLAGRNDSIVKYDGERVRFDQMNSTPRRFAAIDSLGHLFCTDYCWLGAREGGLVQIALDHGIWPAALFKRLGQDGCEYMNSRTGSHYLNPRCGWQFVNYASTAAFEEVLRCESRMRKRLRTMRTKMPIPQGCPAELVFEVVEHLDAELVIV